MIDEIEEKWYGYKVILVGESGTGKSCIVNRYVNKTFSENTPTTIGNDFCIKTQEFQGENVKLKIWDTSGQQAFRSIADLHFKGSDIVICVFALDDEKSLDEIKKYWIPHTKNKTSKQEPKFFLFGNKSDKIQNMKEKNKEIEETLNHLQKDFDCTYFYGSAKNMEDEGISKMMKIIIECLYEQIPKHELKSSKLKESRKKAGENRIKDQRESFKIRSQIIDDYPKQKKRSWC